MQYRILILLVLAHFGAFAQSPEETAYRPNIPGRFIVDFGINRTVDPPDNFELRFLGSGAVNLYYMYPVNIGNSPFTFNVGGGFSLERFKFQSNVVLVEGANRSDFQPGQDLFTGVSKSLLVTNYLDFPLEFRYDTKPEDLASSFNIALGGRIGYLYNSFVKVKYNENGETKAIKNKQNYGLNELRYGVYTRIGIGGFNAFTFYNLTPLFKTDEGPDRTEMSTFTVGLSINAF